MDGSPDATAWTARPERPEDRDAVRRILLAAFPTAEEADLVDALRTDEGWIDGLAFVVDAPDAGPVAFALLTRSYLGSVPVLTLAPVAVLPEYQRRGLGQQVIRAVLDAARARHEWAVTVLGHPEYYPRFGFERASEHGVRMHTDVPDEALMVLALADAPIPAGTIDYAAPFGGV